MEFLADAAASVLAHDLPLGLNVEEKAARIDFFLNKGTWQQFLSELRSKGKYESVLKDFIEVNFLLMRFF